MQKRIPIATIKLAPGEAGYYDEYSRIYLSSTRPDAVIYSGTNCTQIKRSIKSGRLRLVSGGFDKPVTEPVIEQQTPIAATEEAKEVPVQEEEVKTEEEVASAIVEEQAPEVKEEIEVPVQEVENKTEEAPVVEEVKEAPVKKSRRKNRKQETVETFVEETVAEENV